jgi:HSP20 family protein
VSVRDSGWPKIVRAYDRFEEVAVSVLRFDPFGDPFRQMDRLTNQLLSGTRTPMGMPMDVWQTEGGFHVCLDLPGVDPDSVDITTERNVLTIKAERRAEYQQGQNILIAERPQGTFTRQLQLGDTVDTENIQASYADGVLHLDLPITQAAQPRRVQVKTDSSGRREVTVEGETEESASASGATTDSGTQGVGT